MIHGPLSSRDVSGLVPLNTNYITVESGQYHAPGTPMRMAIRETSRPIPENNAMETSGLLSDWPDEVDDARIGAEIRTAFSISGSPMHG